MKCSRTCGQGNRRSIRVDRWRPRSGLSSPSFLPTPGSIQGPRVMPHAPATAAGSTRSVAGHEPERWSPFLAERRVQQSVIKGAFASPRPSAGEGRERGFSTGCWRPVVAFGAAHCRMRSAPIRDAPKGSRLHFLEQTPLRSPRDRGIEAHFRAAALLAVLVTGRRIQ